MATQAISEKAAGIVAVDCIERENEDEDKEILELNDSKYFVYWSVFFVGLVILLPWNILITVSGYWDYKFRNVSLDCNPDDNDQCQVVESPPSTELQKIFPSYIAIASNVPGATFTILHALFGHKFEMRKRILYSQIAQILVFFSILVLALVNSDSWQYEFLIINLVVIVFINIFCAIFQGSFTANMGKFPVSYMGSCINGAGMGGLLPSVVNVIILAANSNFQIAGFCCFFFAELMAIAAFILTYYLDRNPFYHHCTHVAAKEKPALSFKSDIKDYLEVFRHAGVFIIITLLNFTVTLIVFPGVTALIEPEHYDPGDWDDVFFVPVLCFVIYNLGDVIGKSLASWIQWPQISTFDQTLLLVLSIARFAFVPAFMFCNVVPDLRDTEILFKSEYWYVFFMVLLSISNGYIGNIALMFGPKTVRVELQEMTAAFLLAALVIGCGVGSIISTPIVNLL